jgi:hypothetical protein
MLQPNVCRRQLTTSADALDLLFQSYVGRIARSPAVDCAPQPLAYRRYLVCKPRQALPTAFDSAIRPLSCAGSYRAGKARNDKDGSRTPAVSPAETGPPDRTTPSTPHLNGGHVSADESTCRLRPARKRSMRTQGVPPRRTRCHAGEPGAAPLNDLVPTVRSANLRRPDEEGAKPARSLRRRRLLPRS